VVGACRKGTVLGILSDSVQLEAERNVEKKSGAAAITRLALIIATGGLRVIETPSFQPSAFVHVNSKDKHVYAAAMAANVTYIITHDRALIREINQQGGVLAMTPGDFLQQVVPQLPLP
jgi:rRNA-processing protein FCF1